LRKGEAEIKVDPAVVEARGYGGAPCFDALLGSPSCECRKPRCRSTYRRDAESRKLSSRQIELRELPASITGFCVQFSDTYVPWSGAPLPRSLVRTPGCGGVRPVAGIQVAQALVQRGGIRHAQRILQVA